MKEEREFYFPTKAKINERWIPERIEKRKKKRERKEKLAKRLSRFQKPLLSPVKKRTKDKGARVSVQGGIKTLIDLA